jgi:GT2 family glycosyltransferase
MNAERITTAVVEAEPKVFIIILHWNRLHDILECLTSVFELDYHNYEVVVVDNASQENSAHVILGKFPTVHFIRNTENLGFAGGNNVGMQYAMDHGAGYIWLLNNDAIATADSLRNMIELAQSRKEIGLVSPIIYYLNDADKPQWAGNYVDWRTLSIIGPEDNSNVEREFQGGNHVCLWGTALLVKSSVVDRIGYLNERYFAYWEDMEYSLRSLTNGFVNRVCTSARIYHKEHNEHSSAKEQRKSYFLWRNRILLGGEYIKSAGQRVVFRMRVFAELADYMRRCPKDCVIPASDGAWHGLKSVSGPMRRDYGMPSTWTRVLLVLARLHPVLICDILTGDLGRLKRRFSRIVRKGT